MLRVVNNSTVKLIGDPHLGRKFTTGVSLDRRGEREELQRLEFVKNLQEGKARTVIIMGDLFDQFRVDNDCLITAYDALAGASWAYPETTYLVIRGNHDVSRNTEVVSSFEILERMLIHRDNIVFISEPTYHMTPEGDTLLLVPYDAFTPASELVQTSLVLNPLATVAAAFGHWDKDDFGSPHNLIPTKELSVRTSRAFTGHIHSPTVFQRGGVTVEVTGSMLPYAHGEDPTGQVYCTVTLAELENQLATSLDSYHDKIVRVLLKPGESPPDKVDALQFTYKYVGESEVAETQVEGELFSFKAIFDECMKTNGVSEDMTKVVWDKYREMNKDA